MKWPSGLPEFWVKLRTEPVALFTAIIAVVTTIYAVVAYCQLQAMNRTLEISERPWMVNAGMRPTYPKIGSEAFVVEVVLRNTGKSPAIDFEATVSWLVGPEFPDPPPYPGAGAGYISKQVVGPGPSVETLSQNVIDLSKEPAGAQYFIDGIERGTHKLFIYGRGKYVDQFGKPHGLLFCQWWQKSGWALCSGKYNKIW